MLKEELEYLKSSKLLVAIEVGNNHYRGIILSYDKSALLLLGNPESEHVNGVMRKPAIKALIRLDRVESIRWEHDEDI